MRKMHVRSVKSLNFNKEIIPCCECSSQQHLQDSCKAPILLIGKLMSFHLYDFSPDKINSL